MRQQQQGPGPSFQHRRYFDRLSMLLRIQNGLLDLNTDVIQPKDSHTRGSQRLSQLQASKSTTNIHSTLVLSVTGIDSLPLLPTSRPSGDSGKASPACLPQSYNPTRQPATC